MLPVAAAFARASFQQQLAYRVANWAGLFTNAAFLLFRCGVFVACYRNRTSIGDYSVLDATSFVTVTQAILMVAPVWGAVGLASDVRTGQIAVDLLRPVDLFAVTMARRLGISAYFVFARTIPLLAIGAGLGLLAPPSPLGALAFLVSVALGAWIGVAVLFLVEASSFWLESERGVRMIVVGLSTLPSGLLLPVDWYPGWVQTLFRATPFAYTLDLPAAIWLGQTTGHALAVALAVQVGWALAMTGLCRFALARGARRLQAVGG